MTCDEFKALREDLGITQQRLANYLGKSKRSIQDYEYGTTKIPKKIEIDLILLSRSLVFNLASLGDDK